MLVSPKHSAISQVICRTQEDLQDGPYLPPGHSLQSDRNPARPVFDILIVSFVADSERLSMRDTFEQTIQSAELQEKTQA
ncbi:hypothetical protein ST47_g44 [Ascochyta rabiei]|uniref:Uncharacterized protein n=1 Tax=Didymella rabiei TaxID=5454 RepID=A0A163MLH7_DIDRA|nr:hypothetical protein ST47_g44 [Ascochyta rabiei]